MSGLLRALCAPPAVRCLRLLPPPLTPDDEPAFLEAAQQLLTLTLTRTRTRTRTITITLNLTHSPKPLSQNRVSKIFGPEPPPLKASAIL